MQRRGAILEALYRIFEGFWFSPIKLIMTALFHFEEKIHRKNLSRTETIPLMFMRLLSQVLEHLGFPAEPHLECRRVCDAVFTVEKWQFVLGTPPLPLTGQVKDQPPLAVPAKEPHIPASTAPSAMPPAPVDSAGPSTSALPMETIPIYPHDFLAIITAVRTFATTSASFTNAHAALVERMARTEVVVS